MDRYVIIKQVAAGAFGKVYKAKHIASLRTVAIKVVQVNFGIPHLKSLLREIRVLNYMAMDPQNEFTVKLLDAFFNKGDA